MKVQSVNINTYNKRVIAYINYIINRVNVNINYRTILLLYDLFSILLQRVSVVKMSVIT